MRSKQTRYSVEFKQQIVKETLETGNAALVARKHDLIAGTVTRWVREFKNPNNTPTSKYNFDQNVDEVTKENDQLKKLLGEKDLEIAILRDLFKKKRTVNRG